MSNTAYPCLSVRSPLYTDHCFKCGRALMCDKIHCTYPSECCNGGHIMFVRKDSHYVCGFGECNDNDITCTCHKK